MINFVSDDDNNNNCSSFPRAPFLVIIVIERSIPRQGRKISSIDCLNFKVRRCRRPMLIYIFVVVFFAIDITNE